MNPSRTLSLHNAAQSLVMNTRSTPLDPKEVMAAAAELYRIGPLNVELEAEVKRLQAIVDEVHSWAVCGIIASAEDMCENLPRIVSITGPQDVPAVSAVPMSNQNTAVMSLTLLATSGYMCESEYPRVTPEQYGKVVGILEGKL